MLVIQIFSMCLIAVGLIATYIICSYKNIAFKDNVLKILSGILAGVFFLRFMWGYDALSDVYNLNSEIGNKVITFISIFLNFCLQPTTLFIILYPFFKSKKLTVIVKTWGLVISILSAIFLTVVTKGIVGVYAYWGFNLRTLLIGIEIGLIVGYTFIVFLKSDGLRIEKEDAISFAFIIPFLLLSMMSYVPKGIFGYANPLIEINNLTLWHRVFLYFNFIIPIAIHFSFRKSSFQIRKFVLLYLSLSALLVFLNDNRFEDWLHIDNWPLHLCHTAMFILPICLIFKIRRLFYFTYFINVLGAFFAMVMPNTDSDTNVLSSDLLRFWSNHYFAFFMPILFVSLDIFKRPGLKEFIYSAVAFTIYFFVIMFINSYLTGIGKETDFFFINSDFIADKLGKWAVNLRSIEATFTLGGVKMIIYPAYQILYWFVYILMSAGMWFLYELIYNFIDTLIDIRKRKEKYKLETLALLGALNGRKKEEPMYMKNTNKMILHNFTKIYGKSNVYAVKDANLEIHGGEIFGFLGPNGAGKSTIIKSIVGIQPITEGRIEVCGFDVDKQSVMAKRQIGFVPDHYALYEKLTGREYINYIADLYGVSKEDRTKRINKYVEIFELNKAFDNQMKTYSHGMKQKIAIMSALVHNPKVWILDEPLTGLDPNSIYQVKECMKLHAKEGNIVFFSSHIIDVVERICDRIGIIKKGQIQCVKSIKEIEKSGVTLENFYMDIINNKNIDAVPVKNEKEIISNSAHKPIKKGVKNA